MYIHSTLYLQEQIHGLVYPPQHLLIPAIIKRKSITKLLYKKRWILLITSLITDYQCNLVLSLKKYLQYTLTVKSDTF